MDVFAYVFIVGLACLGIAGIVALTRPFEQWKSVAVRMTSLGVVLTVGSLVVRAITVGPGL
jgi:hypothetical protein